MRLVQIQPRSNIVPITDWQTYRRDGGQFLHAAEAAVRKGVVSFTPEVLYNLVAMAIEKLIMAFLMKNGDLAENHTMTDLLDALERHVGRHPQLTEDFAFLASFQDICELESYRRIDPTPAEIDRIIAIGLEVQGLLAPHLLNIGDEPTGWQDPDTPGKGEHDE